MAKEKPQIYGVLPHVTAILLTLTAFILFFLIVLYNAPLGAGDIGALEASKRFWLVTVTDNDPIVFLNPTSAKATDDGRPQFGFGVWGWCEWARGDDVGDAYCRTHAFWRIPRDAHPRDDVLDLDLPRYAPD